MTRNGDGLQFIKVMIGATDFNINPKLLFLSSSVINLKNQILKFFPIYQKTVNSFKLSNLTI